MDPNQIIGAGALGYLNIKNSKNTNIIKATNYLCSCDDGSYLSRKDESIDILRSLGIIEVMNDSWLSAPKCGPRYQTIENILKNFVNRSLVENESLELNKCCLKIKSLGRSLCHCISE